MARTFSGLLLREHRTRRELRPEQLALQVERSVYAIHEYERGRALPSVGVLAALADALDCAVDDLFVNEPVMRHAA